MLRNVKVAAEIFLRPNLRKPEPPGENFFQPEPNGAGCFHLEREGGLTPKQRMFVLEYLVDLNATKAAIRAGFSKKTAKEQGARLLTKVHIAEEISRAQDKRAKRLEIDGDAVVKQLVKLGFASLGNFMAFDGPSGVVSRRCR